jgi:DNA-binding beta-propeller fold protein YncE
MTVASRPGFRRRRIVWISAAALAVTVIVIAAIAAVNRWLGPPVIRVGQMPQALAVTPNGRTLYVANIDDSTVTPITVATGRPGGAIRAGHGPQALAVTPDGRTLYVADILGGTVAVISLKG